MADNEKLLEAARMIQEHCKHTKSGEPCPLAFDGVCNGAEGCGISNGDSLPEEDWHIPEPCRWTESDILIAKALASVGYTSVRFLGGSYNGVFARDKEGLDRRVPPGLFCSVKSDKAVKLSDIIAEYSEVTGHEV